MTELYYIKVFCQKHKFKVLIDSGAQISVISPTMIKLLNLKNKKKKMVMFNVLINRKFRVH